MAGDRRTAEIGNQCLELVERLAWDFRALTVQQPGGLCYQGSEQGFLPRAPHVSSGGASVGHAKQGECAEKLDASYRAGDGSDDSGIFDILAKGRFGE